MEKDIDEKIETLSYLSSSSVQKTQTSARETVLLKVLKTLNQSEITDLPEFDGDLYDWPNFNAEFWRSTKEQSVTESDNLRRLEKSLKGNARDSVKTLLNSPLNVPTIMSMLQTNFGQPRWVAMNLLEEAKRLDPVSESLESHRKFFCSSTGIVNVLKNINAENYLLNPELLSTLADKLSVESRKIWGRQMTSIEDSGNICTVEDFCDW